VKGTLQIGTRENRYTTWIGIRGWGLGKVINGWEGENGIDLGATW
jgi:hypothetical protein